LAQTLCEALQFDSEMAANVHSDIYKTKLESLLEKKLLTDDDMETLLRLRVLLCIPEATVRLRALLSLTVTLCLYRYIQ
jgi:hypothetical protein